jgi:hypothetical protein
MPVRQQEQPSPFLGLIIKKKSILAKLDRILVSVEWDNKYLLASVTMFPKEVSDHNLLSDHV